MLKKELVLSNLKIYKHKSVSEIFDNTPIKTNTLFHYINYKIYYYLRMLQLHYFRRNIFAI